MYFTSLAVNAACAPAHNQSSGGSETSQPNSSSFFKTKNKTNINELVMVKKSDDRLDSVKAEGHFKAEKGGAFDGIVEKGDGFRDIMVKPSNVIFINNANVNETEFVDAFGGSSLGLKEMIKDETKGTVKTDFELDSCTGGRGFGFEEGPDLKGSGRVLKEATKKENPESGGDSAHPIRNIAVKPSNGISINIAKVYETECGGTFGGSGLALKEVVKDETEEIDKAAMELDDTGDVVFGFGEVTDPMLKDATDNLNDAFELDGTAEVGFGSEVVETVVDSDEMKGLSIKSGGADALAAAEGVVPRSGNVSQAIDLDRTWAASKFSYSKGSVLKRGLIFLTWVLGPVVANAQAIQQPRELLNQDKLDIVNNKLQFDAEDESASDKAFAYTRSDAGEEYTSHTLPDSIKHLEDLNRAHLRGVKDNAEILNEVRDVVKSHLNSLSAIQTHVRNGEKEQAGDLVKAMAGDINELAESSQELKLSSLSGVVSRGTVTLDDIPSDELANSIAPHLEEAQEYAQDLHELLRGIDMSFFASNQRKKAEKVQSPSSKSGPAFDGKFARQSKHNKNPSSFMDSLRHHHFTIRSSIATPKLSQFSDFHRDVVVQAKHQERVEALGDRCKSGCDVDDEQCNCKMLFGCVREMTSYDIAVLIAGGYLDSNPSSDTYGNFTISDNYLNLYDADDGVIDKLQYLKGRATDANAGNKNICQDVMQNLFSACNPNEETCTDPNSQSFALSAEEVCDAVNTRKKLLFETIGDEFDGFANKFAPIPTESLGYDVCSEFAVQFDRMYEGRDKKRYPLDNPMLINPDEPVHDQTNTNTILNRVQFPVRYNFPQNSKTGVVTRQFQSQSSQNQYFYLANPDTGMVLSAVQGTDEVEAQVRDSNNADCQLWKLSTLHGNDGRIENKCTGKFLTNSYNGRSNRCRDGNKLIVVPRHAAGNADSLWTITKDDEIINWWCISENVKIAVSMIKDNSITKIDYTDTIPIKFVNPESNLVLGAYRGYYNPSCKDGVQLELQEANVGDSRQEFFIKAVGNRTWEIENKDCQGKFVKVKNDCGTKSEITLGIRRGGNNSTKWKISSEGKIESVHCKGMVLELDYEYEGADILLALDKEDSWSQEWSSRSNAIRLLLNKGAPDGQQWKAFFKDGNYDFALLPRFPDKWDKMISKSAMQACDNSMNLLLGPTTSLGRLRTIADLVTDKGHLVTDKGHDFMPGECCLDAATNSEFFGYRFDPTLRAQGGNAMECQHPGPFHLRISKAACESAGGTWNRSPCFTLSQCIDDRPARFDMSVNNAKSGSCQSNMDSLNTAYVTIDTSSNFAYDKSPSGCLRFCRSLPDYSLQIGMETGESVSSCTCLYNNGQVPNRALLPTSASRSLPKMSLKDASGKLALGLSMYSDCTFEKINVELQQSTGSSRQMFRLTKDQQLVSVMCPDMVLVLDSVGDDCTNGAGLSAVKISGSTIPVTEPRQQWYFDTEEGSMIVNLGCKDSIFRISAIQEASSTIVSEYFSLENSKTHLSMGIEGTSCQAGTKLVLQKTVYGIPYQQFYLNGNNKLVSAMCPNVAIGSSTHCQSTSQLELVSEGNGYVWNYNIDNARVETSDCTGDTMFMSVGGVLRKQKPLSTATPSASPSASPLSSVDQPQFQEDSYKKTSSSTVTLVGIGSPVILTKDSSDEHYLSWEQKHERFQNLKGPYSLVSRPVSARPHLALSIEDMPCAHGMPLKVQADDYSSISQEFYLGPQGSIISAKCPGYVVAIDGGTESGCTMISSQTLKLHTYQIDKPGMKWKLNKEGGIESVKCPGVVIDILGGAGSNPTLQSSGGASTSWRTEHVRFLNSNTQLTPHQGSHYVICEDGKEKGSSRDCAAACDGQCCVGTDACKGFTGAVKKDGVSCTGHTACMNAAIDLVMDGCNGDYSCPLAMLTSVTNGCKAESACDKANTGVSGKGGVKIYRSCNAKLACEGTVYAQDNLTLKGSCNTDEECRNQEVTSSFCGNEECNHPEIPSSTGWLQKWFVTFSEDDYSSADLPAPGSIQSSSTSGIKCYLKHTAFNRAFETFASLITIDDPSDQNLCSKAREEMGFDADHPFDTEICSSFNEHMCDIYFSGIDHMTDYSTEPPQFEKATYEAVDYEEVYYEAPDYDLDPELSHTKLDSMPSSTEVKEDDEHLVEHQRNWLKLGHLYFALDRVADFASGLATELCNIMPKQIPVPIVGPIPNPFHYVCMISPLVMIPVFHAMRIAAGIAYQMVSHTYELATFGPHRAVYGWYYSKATYQDMKAMKEWEGGALIAINENINNQHTSMREHLQKRHLSMEINIGQDLVDLHNALGEAIVDAQNSNGNAIVDAHNAVSDQHNKILKWMHEKFPLRICQVYKATGGECQTFIGPLKQDDEHPLMEFYWPEDKPSLGEALKNIETLDSAVMNTSLAIENKVNEVEHKVEEINARIDGMKKMMSQLLEMLA